MKKILLLFFILHSSIFILQAQNVAMQTLDAAAARVNQIGGIRGNFTATNFNGKSVRNEVSGSLLIQGQKYALSTPDMHTWYNGEYLWSLIAGSNEVNQTKPTAAELHKSSPTAFLKIYKSGYDLTQKTVKLRGKKVSEVTMKAIGKSKQPQRVIVDIEPASGNPMCLRILYKGNWTRVTITNIQSGAAKESDFEFPSKDYPGVAVIKN